jgi:O-antigen/teichoic acid export membrane protein
MIHLRSILKDSMLYAAATAISKGSQLLVLPLYFSSLAVGESGLIDLMLGFVLIATNLGSLGITLGMAREMGDRSNGQAPFTATAFWISAIWLGLLGGMLALEDFGLATCLRLNPNLFIWLLILTLLAQLQDVVNNHFRWSVRPGIFLALTCIYCVTLSASTYFLVAVGHGGMLGAIRSLCFASAALVFFGVSFDFRAYFKWPCVPTLRRMLAFSAPMVPAAAVSTLALYMPRFVVNNSLSKESLDGLMLSQKAASITAPIIAAFAQSLVPRVSRDHFLPETRILVAEFYHSFLGFASICLALIAATSPWICWFLSNGQRSDAGIYVGAACVATLLNQAYFFYLGLWVARKSGIASGISILSAILQIVISIFAVSTFGIWGALSTSILCGSFSLACTYVFSQKFYQVPFSTHKQCWALLLLLSVIAASILLPRDLGIFSGVTRALYLTLVCIAAVLGGLIPLTRVRSWFLPPRLL